MRPSIAFNPYLRKHHLVDPWPLHHWAFRGEANNLKRHIEYLKHRGGDALDKELHHCEPMRGSLPFHNSFFNRPGKQNYEIAIILLEAGTSPSRKSYRGFTLFHFAKGRRSLSLFRLLLWYDPNYENIRAENAYWIENNIHPLSYFVELWDQECPGVKNVIKQTAKDSRQVKELFNKAEELTTRNELVAAALQYIKVSKIYQEHAYIQSHEPAGYDDFLISHYQEKAQSNQFKAFELCQRHVLNYQYIVDPSAEQKQQHKIALALLISLSTSLKKPTEAASYNAQFKEKFPEESAASILLQLNTPPREENPSLPEAPCSNITSLFLNMVQTHTQTLLAAEADPC